jgi:tetratricopeptide (TPR) repeat protein
MCAEARIQWAASLVWLCLATAIAVAAPTDGPATPPQAQSRLAEIRELYEAAEYDRALLLADEPESTGVGGPETRDIRVYEAVCLLAIGNRSRAAERVENIIRADPMYQPAADLPKRFTLLVDEVRDALRPVLARSRYRDGREKFAAAQYEAASREFSVVLELAGAAHDKPQQELEDLRLLASSFLDLAERALVEQSLAKTKVATPPQVESTPEPAPAQVVPPVAIRQDVPPWPAALVATLKAGPPASPLTGILELAITVEGTVASARLSKPIHPLYDARLLSAATRWKYRPATRNGTPIEYQKRLAIEVR